MHDQNVPISRSAGVSEGAPRPQLTQITPLLRRVIADNPSPFTFTGTCSYILGHGKVAILDPGPQGAKAHLEALVDAVRGETVSHILVTHTHRDHSPLARALKAATGAPIVGCGPHRLAHDRGVAAVQGLDSSGDFEHVPDIVLTEGDKISGPGWTLTAIATPGHTANHLAFALEEERALLSGDHVMAWSTSIVAPPDGSMRDYLASLQHLLTFDHAIYWPGHGGPVREPQRYVRGLATHRRQREHLILEAVKGGAQDLESIVAQAYPGISPALAKAASLSTLAHLEWLIERGDIHCDRGQISLDALYLPP
jgi:glyoxylase-like metal-dependent hydrolase (beta-lactamase superfamily II)